MRTLTIGTRGSSLSLCQTQRVHARLKERFPRYCFTVKTIKAQADQHPDVPLVTMGGEGVFVKELETALLDGEIDLAVHSLKDLPLAVSPGITIAAITEREDARDALVSRTGESFERLPAGARIGTSSLRRKSQLLHQRKDVEVVEIRGNVDTRLRKLEEGRYDAIVVAACGLIRLGLEERITQYLSFDQMLPEPGQGALGIEARADDGDVCGLLSELDHPATRACAEAERAFLRALGGGCRVPIAAYAEIRDDQLLLEGAVIAAGGSRQLRETETGPRTSPSAIGELLASRLRAQGAEALLQAIAS